MAEKTAKIRAIYDPSEEARETIRMVYDRRKQMEESEERQRFMRDLDKWEKQWEGYRSPRGTDDWQSNHTVPLTFSVVETALSEMIKQNLRSLIGPRGKEDVTRAKIIRYILNYANQIAGEDMFLYDSIHELLIAGTVIGQEYYRVDRRKIGNITVGKDGKEVVKYEDTLDYDDVYSEVVKHQDFYIDEFARSFTGSYAARDCIRRYIMNIDDFKAMYVGSVWDQFKDADKVKPGGDVDYYEFFKPPQGFDLSSQVEILHYWNKPKDKWDIVANEVLIRDNPSPYKHKQLPFMRGVDNKRAHRFYAKGEPELLESIQDEINILRRMIIDRNHLDIDKMFLVSSKLGLSDEDLIARPHGLIPVDDTNSTKAVEYGDIPRSVELSLKHLEDDATISTGINPRAQALPTAGTATEAAILKESTLRRLETKIFLLKNEYLIRRDQLRVANIIQFYPQMKLEKIVGETETEKARMKLESLNTKGMLVQQGGENFQKVSRSITTPGKQITFDEKGKLKEEPIDGNGFFDLSSPDYYIPMARGGFDITFGIGANIVISKALQQTKTLELYDRLMLTAQAFPGTYDPVKLGDMVIEEYDKNPDDYKPDQQQQQVAGAEEGQRLQIQIQLASQENQMMIQGKDVPSTPMASPAHTQIHTEFMQSPTFQDIPDPDKTISSIFTKHVMGEIMAQTTRGIQGVGGVATPQGMPQMPPGQVGQGGTQATNIAQGKENKPGGMKKSANKVGDVMPGLNTGGSKHLP
jgi:hypothetical protein